MRRRGLAIPLAAGFCVIMSILIGATVFVRKTTNRQQKADWQGLKAHFMAQGAIQVALYKFRILPNEGFYASEEDRNGNSAPLDLFIADVGTENVQLNTSAQGSWTNEVFEGKALNAVDDELKDTTDGEVWKHVVRLKAKGHIQDAYLDTDGNVETRHEELIKTVEVRKIR